MSYQDIGIKYIYDSDEDSILEDFYIPVLSQATRYDRAVAYFSLGVLVYALQGLDGLVKNNGKMRLVIGDTLSEKEYEAVKEGNDQKSVAERLGEKLTRDMSLLEDDLSVHRLKLLSWLVATDSLEIKFALRRTGIFHKKFGIMHGVDNEKLVFQGSANETVMALDPAFNSETINVYPSWNEEIYGVYGSPYELQFEKLWHGNNDTTVTLDLPSTAYEEIRSFFISDKPPSMLEEEIYRSYLHLINLHSGPMLPRTLGGRKYQLGDHQLEALESWKDNGLKGIFALATGAGKTITAIHGAVQIANSSSKKLALIVAVPYQILADQWRDVLGIFNIVPILCYKSRTIWHNKLFSEVSDFTLLEEKKFLAIVVVNATLKKEPFQSLIENIPNGNLLFVGDECHHHDTLIAKNLLPAATLRIGLSATPWSEREDARKEALKSYYGNIVSKYGIDEALKKNVLCSYRYRMHMVYLSEEEQEKYDELSRTISQLIGMKHSGGKIDEEYLQSQLRARGRVLGSVAEKFERLKELTRDDITNHTLFYCGDGSTEGEEQEGNMRDVEKVSSILGENNWKTSRFTAEESSRERDAIMNGFKNTLINGIVAIRVLDEGFDLPVCKTAFLLGSSRNRRQFVQRRGRILRKTADSSSATIHDFIVLSHDKSHSSMSMVESELLRAGEFIRVAENRNEAYPIAESLGNNFGLDFDEILERIRTWEDNLD